MIINDVPVRLTADPEAPRTTSTGKVVVNFSAAYNWRERAGEGFTDVATTFFRCTLWEEDGATLLAELDLKKGALVRVSGRWLKSTWKTTGGEARVSDELTVSSISVNKPTTLARPKAEAVVSAARRGPQRKRAA